ncbi:MAG: type II secretion system F family protein [Fimbriimonadia bacterium]
MKFRYTARDAMGHEVSGLVTADTSAAVQQQLRSRGYDPLAVEPVGHVPGQAALRAVRGGISPYALAPFYSQLAMMLKAGMAMPSALESLSRQTANPRLRAAIIRLSQETDAGSSLREAMQRCAPTFSPLEVAIVGAGEKGGFLDNALRHLSDYLESDIEIRRLLRVQLAYPVLLLVFAIVLPFGVNAFIRGVVGSSGMTIKAPLSDAGVLLTVAAAVIVVTVLFRLAMRSERFRLWWDAFRLNFPVVGKTARIAAMGRFGRALGALHASGVPLGDALRLAGDSSGSVVIASKAHDAAPRIEAGAPIAQTLADTQVFSPMLIDMLRTGEQTGELNAMMTSVAQACEAESKVRAKQSAMGFSVLVYVGIMIYIAYMILSFYAGYATGLLKEF